MFKRSLLLLLCLLLTGLLTPVRAQEDSLFAPGLRPQFQSDLARFALIPEYTANLQLTADFEQAVVSGAITIRYTNTTEVDLPDLVLRVYPNLRSFYGDATLSNVTVDGVPVTPSLDETRSVASLVLPAPLRPGNAAEIAFDYSVTIAHGEQGLQGGIYEQFSYIETELALASLLPLMSVYDPVMGWWRSTDHVQGDAVYSEIANFDISLTYPDYLKVITSGSEIENVPDAAAETITSRYVAPLMRDFSLMASRNYATLSGQVEDITVNIHYLPGHEAEAELALAWSQDAISAFTEAFGEYVYSELDVVETYTSAGGIEYPGLIVVASRLWTTSDNLFFQIVTVHEVAHQWWYAMVGNDQVRFPWVDESLTNYSVAIYYDYINGEQGYQAVLSAYDQQYQSYAEGQGDLPIGEPAIEYTQDAYSPIVYGKGGLFYGVLADQIGQETLLTGLGEYFETHKYRVASPLDIQTALENAVGGELDELFTTWVGYSN